MKFEEFCKKSDELVSAMRETDDEIVTQMLKTEWWTAAVSVFNEEIAGTVTLADGRTVEIFEI